MIIRDSTVAKNIKKKITGFDNNNLTYRREIGFKEQIDLMVDKINNIMVDNIESSKTTKSYEEITRVIKSLLRYETQYSVCEGKYRIDYYFPKIKLCVEYDEKYHESEFQKEKDKNREEDIIRYLHKKDNYINNSCEECDKYEFIRIKQDNELEGIITLTTKVLFKVKDIIDTRKMNCKYYDLF